MYFYVHLGCTPFIAYKYLLDLNTFSVYLWLQILIKGNPDSTGLTNKNVHLINSGNTDRVDEIDH